MREYFTEAIILDREESGEQDSRVILYTPGFGKIIAHATSTRKITSKLSPHLEPLNVVQIRLIKKKRFQIGDVLRMHAFSKESFRTFQFLTQVLPLEYPDQELWEFLKKGNYEMNAVLTALGFDPRGAVCSQCNSASIISFSLEDAAYFCATCFPRAPGNAVQFTPLHIPFKEKG
jgi:recombinational DNA repair protein (RecF pathway)